jgi:hypothetical protein
MPDNLTRAFLAAADQRAARRAPGTPLGAEAKFGWNAAELASRFGVSPRTARRWRQFDTVPISKQREFDRQATAAQEARQRERISRRGLSGFRVQGRYRISKSVYETHPDSPVRIMEGEHISGEAMREFYGHLEQGDGDAAEAALAGALGEAYGVGDNLSFDRVDRADFTIR